MPDAILEALVKYGPGAVFAVMWWLERTDRIGKDDKLSDLAERTIVLMTELKGLVIGRGGKV